jgi:hypothetical protein
MIRWLKSLFDTSTDPVKHCDVYRDKAAGSCVHVDGPLCDFPSCSMLADYRHIQAAASQAGLSYAEALAELYAADRAQSGSCAKPEGHLRQEARQDEQEQESGVKP